MRNSGFVILNERDVSAKEPAVFCVLGLPGGGTTMTARLLESAGISMGEDLSFTAEDRAFSQLLAQPEPSPQEFRKLVTRRNEAHAQWGFKAPFRNHWHLLSTIENVRYVVVFRDVLAVTSRIMAMANVDLMKTLPANLGSLQAIVRFVTEQQRPTMMFSYEKAVLEPGNISLELLKFCGAEPDDSSIARLSAIVRPNDETYLTGQQTLRGSASARVDVLTEGRVAGWARQHRSSLPIEVEIDGVVVASGHSDKLRPDLQNTVGGDGRYGFDFSFDPALAPAPYKKVLIRNRETGATIHLKTL